MLQYSELADPMSDERHRMFYCLQSQPGYLVGNSAVLMIERLRVRIPSGAAGEFSSPGFTLCADSYSVPVPPPYYRNGT